ncbi:MAG: CPXCG motif-containing cysteine-rich protein [Flavobacteriaceae bacterium]|nr:CPXCG motif-containing cysteine-rich protein [Flavobacteriaceae bacterium]
MHEHFFQCPYCWEEISVLVDLSVSDQQYVEDCEVCCNPIQLRVTTSDLQIVSFSAESLEQ